MIYTILTLLLWGFADLFYKKGNKNGKLDFLKTAFFVGIAMGLAATFSLLFNNSDFKLGDIIIYLPVSLCYMTSMTIGYKALSYLELSIISPISNSSGIITSILLCILFKIALSFMEATGIIVTLIGIILITIIELKENKKSKQISKWKIHAIIFPILYCLIDGLGTFIDAIYLDKLNIISETSAFIAFGYSFFIYGLISFYILKKKKREQMKFCKEKNKILAALFETIGQFTYVYAISGNSEITVPIVACYSTLSVLLSRLFLREKLDIIEYIGIICIFIGIIILSVFGY